MGALHSTCDTASDASNSKPDLFSPSPVTSPRRPKSSKPTNEFTFATPPRKMQLRSSRTKAGPQRPTPQSPDGDQLQLPACTQASTLPSSPVMQAAHKIGAFIKGKPRGKVDTVVDYPLGEIVTTEANTTFVGSTKVYVVDEPTGVFVFNLLTAKECDEMVAVAEAHIASVGSDTSKSWRKLYTYTKQDLPMDDLRSVDEFKDVKERLMRSICGVIGDYYGCDPRLLRPRTWKEPHLLKYSVDSPEPHCGVEMHYDGCNVTWNLMLSRITDYDGGGTYIRTLGKTIKLHQGQVLVHPGELFHKGVDITRGTRYLAVCFVDGFDPEVADTSTNGDKHKKAERNTLTFFD